ncbi:6-phosphogluconolactonase [Halospina denitrificans]|uniref:6-phosphogluconolactonase n=1 Tax=Halospina denitrificans TaxID=332522 RepID=A0A4R7JKT3_9GAMM|nr:6-phosphogluconolactonase [Halospina denitrificans]TDT38612.1 6-phosphogluconolactonase [Halospina denitrificans]
MAMEPLVAPRWVEETDSEALAQRLAVHVADRLREALAMQSGVTLAVSGGRSPARFFEVLSEQELDWERVAVLPVDERLVVPGSPQANEALIREHLLRNRASEAVFVSLLESAPGPAEALARVHWPPVVAVLGMGLDGHTASWFPGDDASLVAMAPEGRPGYVETVALEAPRARVSLNWPALQEVGERVLLVQGDDKRALLKYILEEKPDYAQYPVARLVAEPLTVFWSP